MADAPTDHDIDIDDPRVGGSTSEVGYSSVGALPPPTGPTQMILDAFPGRADPIIFDPEDGLPRPDDGRSINATPPLTLETMVCLEDDRTWVEVFHEEVREMYDSASPAEWKERARVHYDADGNSEWERRSFSKSEVVYRWGAPFVVVGGDGREILVPVRPVRPQCEHLVTRIDVNTDIDNQGRPASPVFRFCEGFRTVGGAPWALMDENVLACSKRYPVDVPTQNLIRKRTEEKIAQGNDKTVFPMFQRADEIDWDALAREGGETIHFWGAVRLPDADGLLFVVSPGWDLAARTGGALTTIANPRYIVLPDAEWQPHDGYYEGQPRGATKAWKGEIMRMAITRPREGQPWPEAGSLLHAQLTMNARACAKALRQGESVLVVSTDKAANLFAACVGLVLGDEEPAKHESLAPWADYLERFPRPAIKAEGDARPAWDLVRKYLVGGPVG